MNRHMTPQCTSVSKGFSTLSTFRKLFSAVSHTVNLQSVGLGKRFWALRTYVQLFWSVIFHVVPQAINPVKKFFYRIYIPEILPFCQCELSYVSSNLRHGQKIFHTGNICATFPQNESGDAFSCFQLGRMTDCNVHIYRAFYHCE